MDLEKIINSHLTRAFDPNRVIPEDTIQQLLRFLRSAPSSVNVQPWHFFVLSTTAAKERLARSLGEGFREGNGTKVRGASHVIIFTTRADLPVSHIDDVFVQEDRDGRFPDPGNRDMWQGMVRGFVSLRNYDLKDTTHWMEKQTYMALGMTMMAAAELGVDATPLEGFDPRTVDAEFDIRESGHTTTVLLALGYPDSDQTGYTVTSRFEPDRLFTFV